MTEAASETQVAEGSQATGDSSAEQGAQEPQSFIDAEGKFKPGWKEHFVPEEMRTDKVFDTFDDVGGGLKMLGSLQKMIGKKGVIIPGEASPPSEWDNFHREMGRPDTKDLYKMEVAEDLKEAYDPNLVAEARDIFHELGFDQKKVDRLWAFEEKRIREALKAVANQELEADNAFSEWSAANPEKLHWANRLISENINDEEHKKALLKTLDNNIAFAELLHNISAKFKEHKIITETEQPTGITAADALTEAKKIENTPGFLLPDGKGQFLRETNRPEYERLEKERDKFYKLANVKPG
jgi:hypothetical protein